MRTKKTNERLRNEIQYNRAEVLEIFGNECEICGFYNEKILEIHHILPLSKGGSNNWDNLSVLCPNCHRTIHFILNSNRPLKDLEKLPIYFGYRFGNFLEVLSKCNTARIKQNEIEKIILRQKIINLKNKEKLITKELNDALER